MGKELPITLPAGFRLRPELRHHVTPKLLLEQPVHRWFWFPQSFSPQLLDEVLRAFPIPREGRILDPFVGAGTTVLRALQLGHPAAGTDISPISLIVSRAKTSPPDRARAERMLREILAEQPALDPPPLPKVLRRAFTGGEIRRLLGLRARIDALPEAEADFFRVVFLRVSQRISRAVPDGGWTRWVEKPDCSGEIPAMFEEEAMRCLADLSPLPPRYPPAELALDDARILGNIRGEFDLVLTSPPYPNRHDYSRIFQVELFLLGFRGFEVKRIRHFAFRSHVEARAISSLPPPGYRPPDPLPDILADLRRAADPRIPRMLSGYFEDLYRTLIALRPRIRPGGVCAFVVGNVRYAGIMVPVDELLARIGEQAGYVFLEAWVARLRGNSAQQMGRFGREPSRESVVFLGRMEGPAC